MYRKLFISYRKHKKKRGGWERRREVEKEDSEEGGGGKKHTHAAPKAGSYEKSRTSGHPVAGVKTGNIQLTMEYLKKNSFLFKL